MNYLACNLKWESDRVPTKKFRDHQTHRCFSSPPPLGQSPVILAWTLAAICSPVVISWGQTPPREDIPSLSPIAAWNFDNADDADPLMTSAEKSLKILSPFLISMRFFTHPRESIQRMKFMMENVPCHSLTKASLWPRCLAAERRSKSSTRRPTPNCSRRIRFLANAKLLTPKSNLS